MASATIHKGPYASIPTTASPGLLFLKAFLPIVDSLDTNALAALPNHLTSDATFTLNNGEPQKGEHVLPMLTMRAAKVSKFGHDVHATWDVARDDGGRTVMYESTSTTVFKEDAEGVECLVKEFNVIELVTVDGAFKAKDLRTYMDPSPVMDRAQVVMGKKGE